jgi:3-phenylpropionate/trans-cinnamate dioxygenase ferredoxin subunit
MSDGFTTVADAVDVPVGRPTRVTVGDLTLALFNLNGEFYATDDLCTHDDASLGEGELFGNVVECPMHGARFDVRSGKALSLPAVYPVKRYEVRVVDNMVQIRL